MITFNKDEFHLKLEIVCDKIIQGEVFIHPTDTIYGLGCDATQSKAISKVREMKERYERPFSIIAPDKTWIRENCIVPEHAIEWLKKLPGPYTLIFKLKNKHAIAPEVNNGMDTIGVRIVNHWFQEACERIRKPIITTSANKIGSDIMTSVENLNQDIRSKVAFIIDDSELHGKPSTLVDLTGEESTIMKR